MPLADLALSRSTLDRAAERRTDPGLLPGLLADDGTAVTVLAAGMSPVDSGHAGVRLHHLTPAQALAVPGAADAVQVFLGEHPGTGRRHVLLALPSPSPRPASDASPDPGPDLPDLPHDGVEWSGLREVGVLLDDTDAGILTASVALAHWHAANPHCARCGARTRVAHAGWARQCPECGTEHYPRTDPAVIMSVSDDRDRILLGRQARWPAKRYSTLAGFVEPGESLEAAVRREVAEEAGVVVTDVQYRGSQPWPFPCSLMLGFHAAATSTGITVDGQELAHARWWTREELAADIAAGELLLPPAVSIARRLIESWYGGPLTDAGEAWR